MLLFGLRRFGRIVANALVLACVATAMAVAVPRSLAAASSPQQTLSSILAAGHAQRSVHSVSAVVTEHVRIRIVGGAATTNGIQRITVQSVAKSGQATVVVVGGAAYVRGDSFVLESFMGFKTAPSVKYAGKWIRIPHSDRDYSTVAEAVTLSSEIDQLRMTGLLSMAPARTVNGQNAIGVKGRTIQKPGVPVTLYARAQGTALPIGEAGHSSSAAFAVSLSHWNEQVHVSAPAGAVNIAATGLE